MQGEVVPVCLTECREKRTGRDNMQPSHPPFVCRSFFFTGDHPESKYDNEREMQARTHLILNRMVAALSVHLTRCFIPGEVPPASGLEASSILIIAVNDRWQRKIIRQYGFRRC